MPVGVIPPNVLAELGPTVATNLDAEVIVAPSIALGSVLRSMCAEGSTARPRFFRRWPPVKHEEWERVLGIVDVDLYVPDLNFVFGEADTGQGSRCILARSACDPAARSRECERLVPQTCRPPKQSTNLAHTYGLSHCADPHCVMWFLEHACGKRPKGPDVLRGACFSSSQSAREADD